jgi:hypothetical protein
MQYSPSSVSWSSSATDARSDAVELAAFKFLLGEGIAMIVKAITTDEPSVRVSEVTLDPDRPEISSSSCACGSSGGVRCVGFMGRKCCLKADIRFIVEDERGGF